MSYSKYVRVNTTDLDLAIRQGCAAIMEWFDWERDGLPYFSNQIREERCANGHHHTFSAAHMPGRKLEALSAARDVLGFDIPQRVYQNLRKWALRVFDNPMRLMANIDLDTYEPVAVCDLHNLREAMYSFVGLLRLNPDDKQAEGMARDLIDTVAAYTYCQTGHWREGLFRTQRQGRTMCGVLDAAEDERFMTSLGRYIEALMRLYRVKAIPEALEQAVRLTDCCFRNILGSDGDFDGAIFGHHTHSTTAAINGMAMLGACMGDRAVLGRIQAFLENGLAKIALDFGWCLENDRREDLVGEINNSSDIMQTCLLLGQSGVAAYYGRAERILRGHILPAQLLDTSFLPNNAAEDAAVDRLAERMRGAFGFPCPYGHEYEPGSELSFNWDIVCGGVSGLCEAKRHVVTEQGGLRSINLLFDYEDAALAFHSPYTTEGNASVTAKQPVDARVRIPDLLDIQILANALTNQAVRHCIAGDWLYLFALPVGEAVALPMQFRQERRRYTFRGKTVEMLWQGEHVIAAESAGRRLCFFPELL